MGMLLLPFLAAMDGTAEIYSVLHDFYRPAGGSDGIWPIGGLAASGDTLYGTTRGGGSKGFGTVFKFNTDGSGYLVLRPFPSNQGPVDIPVMASGEVLYGATDHLIYKLNTDGSGFTLLKVFDDGTGPVLWLYPAPTCMGQRMWVALPTLARSSGLAPMAPITRCSRTSPAAMGRTPLEALCYPTMCCTERPMRGAYPTPA